MLGSDADLSAIADRTFQDPSFNSAAALGAIASREPDNTRVVREIEARKMHQRLMQAQAH